MGNKANPKVWRLLDANANRAREGLRIIEDTARFVLENPKAAKEFRMLRHHLDSLVRGHYQKLLVSRDVTRDSGRSNPSKPYQGGVEELLIANFKRCEEALRVLGEYGRILSPGAVAAIQEIRFKVYKAEKRMLSRATHG